MKNILLNFIYLLNFIGYKIIGKLIFFRWTHKLKSYHMLKNSQNQSKTGCFQWYRIRK